MTNDMSRKVEKNDVLISKLDSTIIIALITAMGYINSFFFLAGYKSYFNISSSFVELNISTILYPFYLSMFTLLAIAIASLVLVIVPGGLMILIAYLLKWRPRKKKKKNGKLSNGIALVVIIILIIFPSFSNDLGDLYAKMEKGFYLYSDGEQEYVVLDKQDDKFIVAPIVDRQVIKNELSFRQMDDTLKIKYVTLKNNPVVEKE